MRPREHCDLLLSFDRVWRCEAYRAGDGVHAAWLDRRAHYEPFWKPLLRRFNRNHRELLALEKALFARGGAGQVIVNSRMVKTEIEQRFGYSATRTHVIYNGVPATTVPPGTRAQVRKELGLADRDYVLLFAGSGWERKGLSFAIRALRRVRSVTPLLLVAGRGRRLGLPRSHHVRFLGPRNDIPRLLAAADALLLPTLYDPFSNACLEAVAAGLPVITTSANGFVEIIEPGIEGEVLEDPADVWAIAEAIEKWSDKSRRDAIRSRLQALGAKFSIQENVRQTLAALTADRPAASPGNDQPGTGSANP